MTAPSAYRAYALLVLTTMCWGANAVAGKFAVGHISPLLLTNLRWGIAGLVALPFAWPYLKRDLPVLRKHVLLLAAYGGIGFAGFNAALYSALNYTSTLNVVIEQAGMPGVIFALNFLVLRSRVRAAQLLGFLMTVAGVALTVSNGSLTRLLALDLNRGDALMLLAILCYGGYTAALRIKPPVHWLSFVTCICGAAWLCSLPLAGWEIASHSGIVPDIRGIAVVLFAALLPGLIAQSMFIRANELIGSNRAGIFVNMVPIFGALFSVVLIGETLHLYHLVALGLVLAGIALAEQRRAKSE
ncbi:DMT family transporter [Salinisphaera aquimarina]